MIYRNFNDGLSSQTVKVAPSIATSFFTYELVGVFFCLFFDLVSNNSLGKGIPTRLEQHTIGLISLHKFPTFILILFHDFPIFSHSNRFS